MNEEQIVQSEEGIFLILNEQGDIIRIPELSRDGSGYFVRSFSVQSALRILNICPGCHREYFIYCKNPDCPLKRKKK